MQTLYPLICKQPQRIRPWRRRPWRQHSVQPRAQRFHVTSQYQATCGAPSWRSKRRATKRRFYLPRTTRSSRWMAIWSRRFSWGKTPMTVGYLFRFCIRSQRTCDKYISQIMCISFIRVKDFSRNVVDYIYRYH